MSMRTSLGRVRGLGAAGNGSGPWIAERLSAVALVPLCLWFVFALMGGVAENYETMRAWLSEPSAMTLLILMVATLCWHMKMALSVVIEDYIHTKSREIAALVTVKLVSVLLAVYGIVSILKIGLGA